MLRQGIWIKGIRHQGLGLIEHFIDSVPKCDYGLTFERLKAKAIKSLRSRGCLGGGLIFHAERFANFEEAKKRGVPIGYYFSPHWHCLGFLDGGYSRCRNCPNVWKGFDGEIHVKEAAKCMACSGFEGRTRREYLKEGGKFGAGLSGSGYVVKIKGARKSVFGTCWYQLNHSTLVKSKRDRVIVWWGVCSYNKLKMTKEDRVKRDSCPICGLPMQPVRRIGSVEVLGDDGWHREFEDDFLDKEGRPNWVVVMKVSSFA